MLRASKLDVAYNRAKDVDVKERILLVRRIVEDEKHIEDVAKKNCIDAEHGLTNGTRDIIKMD